MEGDIDNMSENKKKTAVALQYNAGEEAPKIIARWRWTSP